MNEIKLEKSLFIILVLSFVLGLASAGGNLIVKILYGPQIVQTITMQTQSLSIILFVSSILAHLAIGIWLSSLAKKEGLRKRSALWFLMGLFFGIMAAVFFLLIKMNKKIEELDKKLKKTIE